MASQPVMIAPALMRQAYQPLWDLQERIRQGILEQNHPWVLLRVEHPPTLTLGRAEKGQNLHADPAWYAQHDLTVVEVNRGGMVTYHGPGQLVVYPIVNLMALQMGVKDYVCKLEQTMLDTLLHYGIQATRKSGQPGVYLENQKLGSVGIHIRKWVSIHGLALNVCTDLSGFAHVTPCGMQDITMTSMKALGVQASVSEVAETYLDIFSQVFGVILEPQKDGQDPFLAL